MLEKTIPVTIDGTDYIAVPVATWNHLIRADSTPAPGLAGQDGLAYALQSVGKSLKKLRITAGLTQVEMAAALGVTQGNVANVEAGRARVGDKAVLRWEKVCRTAKK